MERSRFWRSWRPLFALPTFLFVILQVTGLAHGQGWEITGTIEDADGVGISDVDIDILASTGAQLSLSSDLSEADGSFQLTIIDAVPSTFYDFMLIPPPGSGFLPLLVEDVFLAGDTDIGDHVLDPGWAISGFVVDEDGAGLEEIDIEVSEPDGGAPLVLNNDNTDSTGFYQVLVPAGTWDIGFRKVIATGPDYVPVVLASQPVTRDTTFPDVVMKVGYPLNGTVEDSSGDPVEGADIDIRDPLTGDKIQTFSDNTDNNGDFEVIAPAGDWDIEVDPPLGVALAPKLFPVTVEPPPATNDTGVLVLPDGVELKAKVAKSGGIAVAGVDLDLVDSTTGLTVVTTRDDSDAAGKLSVFVEEGTYDVELRPPFPLGLAPRVMADTDVTGTTDLGTLTLESGVALTGTVTDGLNEIQDVVVTLSDSGTGEPVYVFGNKTKIDGSYALRQVAGTYDVTFTPPPSTGLPVIVKSGVDLSTDTVLDVALVESGDGTKFKRGDFDGSGSVTGLTDTMALLRYGFLGGAAPGCKDAADVDGNGALSTLSDALHLLRWSFQGGDAPPAPGPTTCGVDGNGSDALDCAVTATVCE